MNQKPPFSRRAFAAWLAAAPAAASAFQAQHPPAAASNPNPSVPPPRSEEHTSELQSLRHLVCRLLLERYGDHRDLHSFPTRRSSDLLPRRPPAHSKPSIHPPPRRIPIPACRRPDRKSTRLNSSHLGISYAVFCLKDTATTEIYTLSLHDALPICCPGGRQRIPSPASTRRRVESQSQRAAAPEAPEHGGWHPALPGFDRSEEHT